MSFKDYTAAGWKLCAIPPGTKGPRLQGWNKLGAEATAIPPGHGMGLLHAWSGTCAIDVDKMDVARAWLGSHDIDLDALLMVPDSVHISSGREGRAKLLYALPVPLASLKVAPYLVPNPEDPKKPKTYHALEFRCATTNGLTVQDVLPGSIHPETTRPYEWAYGNDLVGDWHCLPPLPPAVSSLWMSLLAPAAAPEFSPSAPVAPSAGPAQPKGAAFPELEALLALQDPDLPYDDWLHVGMAIHHETKGSSAGLALWDAWSQKGAKYGTGHPPQYPRDKWSSFRYNAANPVTIGGMRREVIAAPDEFPLVPVSTMPEVVDTSPKAILESRLVYLTAQDRYYFLPSTPAIANLDEHSEMGLSKTGVRTLFRPHMKPRTMPDGKVKRVDPVEFLDFSKTKTIVGHVGFHPGADRIYVEDHIKYLNRYIPRVIEPLRPKPQELDAWNFLMGRIKDKTFKTWLMKFYAHALQKPGVKIQSAPLLFSHTQGTGKTTLMKTVPTLLFGRKYVRTMSSDVINSRFTGPLADIWWVVLDELKTSGMKMDRIEIANKIKPWITEPEIEIERKGLDPYHVTNRVQITATSQFEDALHIENSDRRWAIAEMSGDTMTAAEKLDLYEGFFLTDRAPGVLQWIFRNESLVGFHPTAQPPETESKKAMARAGLGGREARLIEAMVAGEAPFDRDLVRLKDVAASLYGAGQVSESFISGMMKRAPFNAQKLSGATGNVWAWRNIEHWRKLAESNWKRHIEVGERPTGPPWRLEAPELIKAMSAEGDLEPLDDLL